MLLTRTGLRKNLKHKLAPKADTICVEPLVNEDESEVLEFLSQRPIHTVAMMSLIRDNGVVSPFNRGRFYGCRDINGLLEGIALVGHATLMETVSDRALAALAQVSRECTSTHLIMGEKDRVADFWGHYVAAGRRQRLACREWLFERGRKDIHLCHSTDSNGYHRLLQATRTAVDLVMPVQAELAFVESGVDPRQADPQGFRERCLRRIEQGRTWVAIKDSRLIFKADVISKTPQVSYLEGIWLAEDHRSNGSGLQFMSDLMQRLFDESKSVCLLVNETNKLAQNFYRKCGFHFRATYETIFLPRTEPAQN